MAAAASTFSYAQAAKGQGTTTSNTSTDQDTHGQRTESVPKPNGHGAPESIDTVASSADATPAPAADKAPEESSAAPANESQNEPTRDSSRANSKRDEDVSRLDRPWRRAENKGPTRSSSATTRSVDETENNKKPRKGRKGKAAEKTNGEDTAEKKVEAEPEPKIELSEAPIPSVNIWQQRKETLSKAVPAPASAVSTEAKVNSSHSSGERTAAQAKPAADAVSRDAASSSANKTSKKGADAARTDRNASRGNRATDKSKSEVPPPVGDAVAWPTPETAIKDTKKPAEAAEKVEKPEKDSAEDHKPRQKEKWVTMDYVPSVAFETPISRPSGSKPRGGSRNSGSTRGAPAAGQTGEKSNTSSSTTAVKNTENKERTRETVNGATRSSPQPPHKRGSVDMSAASKENKKPVAAQPMTEKKESAAAGQPFEHQTPREGRQDTRRNAPFRGRGGHHSNVNGHGQHNGPAGSAPNFVPNGMGARGPHYSPPPRHGAHGHMYQPPAPQRGGRGGRNSGNHYNRMSMGSNPRAPPVQTQYAPSYDYQQSMSAMPYQPAPFFEAHHLMTMQMLKTQIEYYFSIDNLCKDMYLRKRMDSQGFVPLHFILAFQRIKDMQSNMAMVRAVCEESEEIDFVVGEDDCERLRRRSGWETFVLPMDDRDSLAQNNGPQRPSFKNRSYNPQQQFNGMGSSTMGYPMGGLHSAPPEAAYQPFMNGAPAGQNGAEGAQLNGTQLSATVPDFAPSGAAKAAAGKSQANGHAENVNGLTNGVHESASTAEAGQA